MCSTGAIAINFELENQFLASQTGKRRLNVNNENIRKRCETCSKLTINRLERPQRRRSSIFIVNFENIPHLFECFESEQVKVSWNLIFFFWQSSHTAGIMRFHTKYFPWLHCPTTIILLRPNIEDLKKIFWDYNLWDLLRSTYFLRYYQIKALA